MGWMPKRKSRNWAQIIEVGVPTKSGSGGKYFVGEYSSIIWDQFLLGQKWGHIKSIQGDQNFGP